MKFKLILFICGISFFAGCNRLIDITPENSLTFKNGLETEKDIESALGAAGQLILATVTSSAGNGVNQEWKGIYADEDDGIFPQRYLHPVPSYYTWYEYYRVIAQANVVDDFVDRIDLPNNRKSFYKGQAAFYKALMYFELIRRFGDCVLVKDEVNMLPQSKSHWPEVADYAIELAEYAAESLPEFNQIKDSNGIPPQYKSVPAKGAANALLAHLCAWKAGGKYFAEDASYDEAILWRKAEAAAAKVIESGQYSLAPNPEEICTTVLVGNSQEGIYEIVFRDLWHERKPLNAEYNDFLPIIGHQGWPIIPDNSPEDIQYQYFRIYSETVRQMYPGNDQRKHAYFYKFEEMAHPDNLSITGGFAYPYKIREIVVGTEGWSAGQFVNYNVNRITWRLADIILLRAECRERLGNNEGAITDLNVVRARAAAELYNPAEYDGDLKYTIFKEREKELLLEGYRYFDIIRNNYARTELLGRFRTATNQDFKDGAFFNAIDESMEFGRNPLLRQNKYWLRFR